jgi:hypothetical protein
MSRSMLLLGDQSFEIESAMLDATLADPYLGRLNGLANHPLPLLWGLEVRGRGRDIGGQRWEPVMAANDLKPRLRRWHDWTGLRFDWSDAAVRADDPSGAIYLLTHEAIQSSSLTFGARDRAGFAVRWQGTWHPAVRPGFDRNVRFRFEGTVTFGGIRVDASERDDAASVRTRLQALIETDAMVQQAIVPTGQRYADGTRSASVRFLPMP